MAEPPPASLSEAHGSQPIHHDLDFLAGSMKGDDFDWDGFLEEIRQIHPDDWKFLDDPL